jgi:hypothetical protein
MVPLTFTAHMPVKCMRFTARPVTVPATSRRQSAAPFCTPNTSSPANTASTASRADSRVRTMSYRMGWPGVAKPSIPMKCISQMPTPPMDRAASTNQPRREPGAAVRDRYAQARPIVEPTTDTT